MAVIDEIAAERKRQIEKEGWSLRHDDEHDGGQMAAAAACYALHSAGRLRGITVDDDGEQIPSCWPWSAFWWKPHSPRRDLVRAGALIIAEIERLDRAEAAKAA